MKREIEWRVLLIGLSSLAAPPAYCHSPRFLLRQDRLDRHHVRINIYDRVRAEALWERPLVLEDTDRLNVYSWSKDHKALAIAEEHAYGRLGGEGFRLWVWRAGEPVRVLTAPWILHQAVTTEQADWSPDDRRLLLRFSQGTGDADIGRGSLWLLDVRRGSLREISPTVSQAGWHGATRIEFTQVFVDSPDTGNQHEEHRLYLIGDQPSRGLLTGERGLCYDLPEARSPRPPSPSPSRTER